MGSEEARKVFETAMDMLLRRAKAAGLPDPHHHTATSVTYDIEDFHTLVVMREGDEP